MRFAACILLLCSLMAEADERITVCFNYGCQSQAVVVYSDEQLLELGRLLAEAHDAVQEREAIRYAVGRLLGWAGKQSPIWADKGGNFADAGVFGGMDCIDHSITTTRLLKMVEKLGLLRYHRVLEPALRKRFLLFDHFSAQIEGKLDEASANADSLPPRFVVDSWFFDNGQPAAVMPLARWLAGESPDVGNKQ